MARKSLVFMMVGTVTLLFASVTFADVPHMITYSGYVTKVHGGPLNGTFQLTFSIYPDTMGSPADWTETQPEVVVKQGLFSILLGSVNPMLPSAFDGGIKYLGVQVESDPEMRPLTPIVSVGYAFRAGLGACTAACAELFVALDLGERGEGFGVLAPDAAQGASLEEDHRTDPRTVVQGVALDVDDQGGFRLVSQGCVPCAR